MLAVVLYEVNDANTVSKLSTVRSKPQLEVLTLLRIAVNIDVLVLVWPHWLEPVDGVVGTLLFGLVQGEGVDIREDSDLVG